ncbi:ANTAR domain-containing protein [Kribbella sp. NPDC050470]|uniref:ANTAR domain-containing protein n=1 Tax=unclassified Kribbella TaxID=2644121 RepID=UPI0037966003
MGFDYEDPGISEAAQIDEAATLSIAMAQGVLIERYELTADSALLLLDDHAQGAGIPVVEAARWLLTAGILP